MAFVDDAGDALGSGLSGGLTGFSIGGPVGAGIGAGVGILSSLLGPKKKKRQAYNDPFAPQRSALINELSNSNTGAQAAALASRQTGNIARDRMEQMQNGPFAGNASVLSGLNSDLLREAETAGAQSKIAGAAQDQNSRLQAGNLMAQGSQMTQNQYQFDALNPEKPSFGESALQNILSYGSGLGMSKLMNPQTTTTTGSSTVNLQPKPNIDTSGFTTPLPDAPDLGPLLDQGGASESPSYTPQMLSNERMGGFGGASFNYDGGSSFDWLQTAGASSPFGGQRSISDIVYGRY